MLNKKVLTLIFVVAFLTLLIGCYPSDPEVIGIKVSPDTVTLSLGATIQLEVDAVYDDGNHGDVTSDCIYVSNNTKVVPLFDDGNLVAGQIPGKATITVTYTSNSKNKVFTDTVEVTVEDPDIIEEVVTPVRCYTITATASLGGSISPSGKLVVLKGSDKTFTITPDTDYQIADVLVDGVSVGAVTAYNFTNVIANHTISATFKVVELDHIVVVPDEMILCVGQTVTEGLLATYSITAYYSDGSTKDIDFDYWITDLTDVDGILDFSDPDNVIAVEEGTGDIIISYTEGGITAIDIVTVTVKELIVVQDSGQNVINEGLDRPYINWEIDCFCIEFTFVNPTPHAFVFDYRVDGEAGEMHEYSNLVITGGELLGEYIGLRYNWVVIVGVGTKTVTVCAEKEVWVGLRVGAENDWFLDWIKFEVK
ncbi:hypothetical protein ES703_20669 [subsurface metagenome]